MKINKVFVKGFRNLDEQVVEFTPLLNVICGKNAQGKTNLLEAIYFATIGKSPRTRKDLDAIGFGKKNAKISLYYERGGVEHCLEIELSSSQGKLVRVDGNQSVKLSDVVGLFGSVYFSPDELKLAQGSPGARRRFVDIINCQLSKDYMHDLQVFQRLMNQRNQLLKNKGAKLKEQLEVWDFSLAHACARVGKARLEFSKKLEEFAKQAHFNLSDSKEVLSISYHSIYEGQPDFEDYYLENVKKSFEKDLVLGYSSFGLQNDDYVFKLNGLDLRKNCSQGQQRTATLALKLAELEILKQEYGEYPVLLLDDVLSELDKNRRTKLIEYFKNIQCLLTCTEFDLDLDCNKLSVADGVVQACC